MENGQEKTSGRYSYKPQFSIRPLSSLCIARKFGTNYAKRLQTHAAGVGYSALDGIQPQYLSTGSEGPLESRKVIFHTSPSRMGARHKPTGAEHRRFTQRQTVFALIPFAVVMRAQPNCSPCMRRSTPAVSKTNHAGCTGLDTSNEQWRPLGRHLLGACHPAKHCMAPCMNQPMKTY